MKHYISDCDRERTRLLRTCRRKRKYLECHAKYLEEKFQKEGSYIHAYQCENCKGWHLGHVDKATRVKMAFEELEQRRAAANGLS